MELPGWMRATAGMVGLGLVVLACTESETVDQADLDTTTTTTTTTTTGSETTTSSRPTRPFAPAEDLPSGDLSDPATLPMAVDVYFAAPPNVNVQLDCTGREDVPSPVGRCHRYDWSRTDDPSKQYVWSSIRPGGTFAEAGAEVVSFHAWGTFGDEVVRFGTGTAMVEIPLTRVPTRYAISLTEVQLPRDGDAVRVNEAFRWDVQASANPGSDTLTFYVDDIEWRRDAEPLEVPFAVDGHFRDRSGRGASVTESVRSCPRGAWDASGRCHRFEVSAGGADLSWVDGKASQLRPRAVAPGATHARFLAWGATGGEAVEFGVGTPSAGRAGAVVRSAELSLEPTCYSLALPNPEAPEALGISGPGGVTHAFGWRATDAVTFFVDDIEWASGGCGEGAGSDPETLPIPFAVDTFFPDRIGFGSDGPSGHLPLPCDVEVPDAVGDCHRFDWGTTDGIDFTGVHWVDGGTFDDVVAKPIEPGATAVRFYAWSVPAGRQVEFGAGITTFRFGDAMVSETFTLPSTPPATPFEVSLDDLGPYEFMTIPFTWRARSELNTGGFSLYIDGIEWVRGEGEPSTEIVANPWLVAIESDGTSVTPVGPSTDGVVGRVDVESMSVLPLAFTLPALEGETFTSANLDLQVYSGIQSGSLEVDLYGVPYVPQGGSIVLGDFYYAGPLDSAPGVTRIAQGLLTSSTGVMRVSTDDTEDAALVAFLNDQRALGAQEGDAILLRLSPTIAPPLADDENSWSVVLSGPGTLPDERPTLTFTE